MADPEIKEKSQLEKTVDKALEEFTDPVLNFIQDFFTKLCSYLEDFDENVKRLELGLHGMASTSDSLNKSVYNESRRSPNSVPSARVNQWNRDANGITEEAARLIKRGRVDEGRMCLGHCCVARFRYGKKVVTCVDRLTALKKEGEDLIGDRAFVEEGLSDGYKEFSDFKDLFRKLRDAIISIGALKDELRSMSGYKIRAWVQRVEQELQQARALGSQQEAYLVECENLGFGSSSVHQREVSSCTKRLLELYGEGEMLLNTAGPSYSS